MKMDPKTMRARFAELREARDKQEAKLAPLHGELEALRASFREKEETLIAKIRKEREPMIEIDQELAMISRALNGKTGEPAYPPFITNALIGAGIISEQDLKKGQG